MASTSEKPKKGILKHSGSIDQSKKEIEWDEMNILATYHPADKDYGFMKVDEPPTPYNRGAASDDETSADKPISVTSEDAERLELDPAKLAERLEETGKSGTSRMFYDEEEGDEQSEEDENLTEDERKKKKAFLLKRKMHYNEFQAVQMAKKLMAEEDDEDGEDEGGSEAVPTAGSKPSTSSAARVQGKSSLQDSQGGSKKP